MTSSSDGDHLEMRLRSVLAALRPAEGAPLALAARIEAIPVATRSTRFAARLGKLLTGSGPMAVLVSAAAIGIAAFALANVVVPAGVGSGGAPLPTFDPTAEGPGLIRFPIPALQIAWVVAVVAAFALALRWKARLRSDEWSAVGRSLLLVLLVAVPTVLVIQPPIRDYGGSQGTLIGFGQSVNPPPGSDGPEVDYVNAASGEPFIVFFDVTNASALPVTLNGMVSSREPGSAGPRWIALALPSDPTSFNNLENLRPFTPQVIAPNDRITLYLVGKAGCSVGPDFALDAAPGPDSYASMIREVQLGYSVLGFASTTTFSMPMQVVEPEGPPCS